MGKTKNMTSIRKNIDLPSWAVNELAHLAETQKNKVKPYMEFLLIQIAEDSWNERNVEKKPKQPHKFGTNYIK